MKFGSILIGGSDFNSWMNFEMKFRLDEMIYIHVVCML